MGFMDELRKLTQPYDEDEDFFEEADRPRTPAAAPVSDAQEEFESSFAASSAPAPDDLPRKASDLPAADTGGLFGNLGMRRARSPQRERTVSFGGNETSVILFSPKEYEDVKELVTYLRQHRSVVMTLEGLPNDLARRLLDLCSGVAMALSGKITPVSAKTFFVTPDNVDIVGAQASGVESDGQYF